LETARSPGITDERGEKMSKTRGEQSLVERRGFLKGSAWLAAGVALAAAAPAAAQAPQNPPAPAEEKKDEPKKDEAPKPKTFKDKAGRDYRVCDMCGANMYLTEKIWTCEQCGYSYEE
jgi:hypothetical protein